MKNLRLAVKIGGGFGLVLLLACAIGVMAVLRMGEAGHNAERMDEEYVPEVVMASGLEHQVQLAMYGMRGFAFIGEERFLKDAFQAMAEADKRLAEGQALSDKFPALVKLRDGLAKAKGRFVEYEKLAGATKDRMQQRKADLKKRTEAAARMEKLMDEYQGPVKDAFRAAVERGASTRELTELYDRIDISDRVLDSINDIRRKVRTADGEDNLALYQAALGGFKAVEEDLAKLKSLSRVPAQIAEVEGIIAGLTEYRAAMEHQMGAVKATLDLNAQRNKAATEVMEAVEEISKAGSTNLVKLAKASAEDLGASRKAMIIGLLAAVAVGALLSVFITRSIVGPVRLGVTFAGQVAGGDYGRTLEIDQEDEIGDLAKSLNAMVASLREQIGLAQTKSAEAEEQATRARAAMAEAEESQKRTDAAMAHMVQVAGELQKVAEVLTTASEELSAQVEQSSHGAASQAQRVGETATAMEEMNATVLEVAKNASSAAEVSAEARAKAEEGSTVVGRVVDSIGQVAAQATALKTDMGELGKRAESIGAIMNVISDIADQTNLLALNAAIEAARAGEAGRGFAVVADEVRKLAEKTMTATKEVGEAIDGIQQGARASIGSVEAAVRSVETATGLANQSGEALAGIVNLVDKATDQVRSIATASEQQSSASEEINRSIEEVSTISSETAQAMTQAAQAVSDLARQAVVLKELIEDMRGQS
jgi:methyl-accepting chemotaxis protein